MPGTKRELQELLHKTLTTRPTNCPIRKLVAWLAEEAGRAPKKDRTVVVVNINARQAAVFGGRISNN